MNKFQVIESFCKGKYSNPELCEDGIAITEHYVLVVDGMTTKSNYQWKGKKGGRLAMETITGSLTTLPEDANLHGCIEHFSNAIRMQYDKMQLMDLMNTEPPARWTASFVIYSHNRNEIWMVGDCICMVDEKFHNHEKNIDAITGNARALMLEAELLQGKSIEDFRTHDPGREMIMPILKREKYFQNAPNSEFAYEAIDGFSVREDLAKIVAVPSMCKSIILGSDGYPTLFPTLFATEEHLKQVLENDPLCFRENRSTKGLQQNQNSYDDRTYAKIGLN